MGTQPANVIVRGRSTVGLLAVLLFVSGCASLSARNPTRPLVASSDMSKDQNDCEAYAKGQTKDKGEYYRACMISRSYAANVEMDDLDWTLGIAQTRPHEAAQVVKDMEECDDRADDTAAHTRARAHHRLSSRWLSASFRSRSRISAMP